LKEKLKFDGFRDEVTNEFTDNSFVNLNRVAAKFADGLTVSSEELDAELKEVFDNATCSKLDYVAEEHQIKEVSEFIDKVIDTEVCI